MSVDLASAVTSRTGRRMRIPGPFAVAALAVAIVAAGCGGPSRTVSFDPGTACASADDEGQMPGAYPDLEALLPTKYEQQPAGLRDSGRGCTPDGLGSLATHGITQVRFAGATWDLGTGKGVTFAIFEGAALTADEMIEFYETGARSSNKTEDLRTSDTSIAGIAGKRLDVLFSDTAQTIVAWPDPAGKDRVRVLLAADLGDAKVAEILARGASDS
jgi:hypothetical protein